MKRAYFYKMKEACKVFCAQRIARLILVKDGTNTLILYFFKHLAYYIPEFGAKQYFNFLLLI